MRAITQIDQVAHDFKDVILGQSRYFERQIQSELVIQLESTDRRKIVAFFVEEETCKESIGALECWRITRAQSTINFDFGFFRRVNLILKERVAQVRANKHVVNKEDLDVVDAAGNQRLELGSCELLVTLNEYFTGGLIKDIGRSDLTENLLFRNFDEFKLFLFDFANRSLGEFAVCLYQDLTVCINNLKSCPLTEKKLGIHLFTINSLFWRIIALNLCLRISALYKDLFRIVVTV